MQPEQVMIVSGTQEALDLAGRLILNPGDSVCLEEPGYPGAAMAFEALGAKVSPVPVDDEGMRLPGARKTKLVYITPGHQFPLGTTMSLARRLQLLDWARRSRTLIFEDDYDSEFRYSGRPIPALQGLDRQGLVLFAGSFSKVLFPALRIGYLVLPSDLVDSFAAAKSVLNRHAPPFEQTVLCDFMVEGHFERHLRRMREVYAERLSTLFEAARRKLQDYCNSQLSKQDCRPWDGFSRELTATPRGGQQRCVRWKSFRCVFTAGRQPSGKDCSWASPP